jgi:acetyl esterase/lipase
MQNKYDIHTDFSRFPAATFKFRGLLLWLINLLMKLHCFFVRRSLKLKVADHSITRPDGSKLKVITMTPPQLEKPAPALIYFHGGGFGMTYTGLHLRNCERYANEAHCTVVFVDYRLAPKYPFPGGFDDCYNSLQWVIREAGSLGIDASRIAVGGDSAGGALAAGVAQKARDEHLVHLCAQLLVYPVLDNTCSTPSATEFIDTPLFNAVSNRNMWQVYLGPNQAPKAPPYAAPGHGQLHDLPLSYVETAEFDPLRDEGLDHASNLKEHGVEVVLNETRRTVHGYDGNAASDISRHGVLARINFLKRAFTAQAT